MPKFLPDSKIKVSISSFESNKWIFIPLSTSDRESPDGNRGLRRNSTFLPENNPISVGLSYLDCCKVPLEVDESTNKDGESGKDIDGDSIALSGDKKRLLYRNYFGRCKAPLEMNSRIIESGIKVLESNENFKLRKELEKKEKAYRDKIEDGLIQLKRQLMDIKMENIEHKPGQSSTLNRANFFKKELYK
jgi:hypothetical protein